ncbi:MAG: helix-turn-helix domain-containing protein [Pseudomonadales bacterium]|nr:helix-turn-helix domain-containing protein [Pseudomonadales bacterium]
MFYLFSRSILFEETKFTWSMLLHIAPVLLMFIPNMAVSISILFCIGTGYSLWLTQVIYNLRGTRTRSAFELFFLCLFTVMAICVLILGFSLPYMDAGYFYYSYALGIGLALILVVGTLLSFPHLLTDLAEAAKLGYTASTLKAVDVLEKKRRLNDLMERDKIFQDEELSLATLAEVVQLSSHQLSELINSEFKMSFSRYVREYRVREGQRLLKDEPTASILSISMQVGFRSQSNFYAAFKEITGVSPGSYRNS